MAGVQQGHGVEERNGTVDISVDQLTFKSDHHRRLHLRPLGLDHLLVVGAQAGGNWREPLLRLQTRPSRHELGGDQVLLLETRALTFLRTFPQASCCETTPTLVMILLAVM